MECRLGFLPMEEEEEECKLGCLPMAAEEEECGLWFFNNADGGRGIE